MVPTPPKSTEEDHAHIMTLPSGGEIFALEKLIVLTSEAGAEKSVVVTVGNGPDSRHIAHRRISSSHYAGACDLYILHCLQQCSCIIAMGLKPLEAVKRGIATMRVGNRV